MNALLFALLFAVFANDFPPVLSALVRAVDKADVAAIRKSIEAMDAIAPLTSRDRELLLYTRGYAAYKAAYVPGLSVDERKALLKDAQKQLEAAIQLNDKNAEAHGLLASVLGGQIAFYRVRTIELGIRSGRELDYAQNLEPNNPRVHLLAGISALHKPEEYGGGIANAEALLRRSVQLFASEPVDRPWPNWGRADAHIWLGQALEEGGKRDAARVEYEIAQKLAPESGFAQAMVNRSRKAQ